MASLLTARHRLAAPSALGLLETLLDAELFPLPAGAGIDPALIRIGARADLGANSTVLNVPYPTVNQQGVATPITAGEGLIVHYGAGQSASATAPAGWTKLDSFDTTTAGSNCTVLYRHAVGGETGNLAISQSNTQSSGQMYAVPGVDLTTLLDVAASINNTGGAAVTSLALPGVTAVTPGALPLYLVTGSAAATTFTSPGFELSDWDSDPGTNSRSGSAAHDTTVLAAAGATGDRAFAFSVARKAAGILLVLRPNGYTPPEPPAAATDDFFAFF